MVAIIGSGMAGLLAGCMFRLDGQIYEAAPSLPNNHHALLRFKSDEIGRFLNIPFREVNVMKINKEWKNPVADAVAYSMKCTGEAVLRSSTTAKGEIERRFIAPPDFISQMERHQNNPIRYGQTVDRKLIESYHDVGQPIISTMPMPVLMKLLDYDADLNFKNTVGAVIRMELPIETEVCATIYYPNPDLEQSRATLTGQLLQIELPILWAHGEAVDAFIASLNDRQSATFNTYVASVLSDFGFHPVAFERCQLTVVKQKYAKILPIDERERKKFIVWATDNFGVYSLGRFAIWQPGLLLDSVFRDAQAIQKMITHGNYDGKKG